LETLALDGDSALPGLLAARPDAQHLMRAGDPGHLKKNFIRALKKLFGQKKVFKGMGEKFGRFYMWSAKNAIALFPGNFLDPQVRENRRTEFKKRFGHCLDHYTNKECLPTCPCHEAGAAVEERTSLDLLEQAILEALQESPAEGEAVVVEPDGKAAIVAAEVLSEGEDERLNQAEEVEDDAEVDEEHEEDEAFDLFVEEEDDEADGTEPGLQGADDDEFFPLSDEEEDVQRPQKKRRVAVAPVESAVTDTGEALAVSLGLPIESAVTDTGEALAIRLGLDRTTARIACHHDKKWLDLSLTAVAQVALDVKSIVV
jgi:hypothetical protein